MFVYLSGEEILALHSEIIDQTGGAHGLRDESLFLSLIVKPQTQFSGTDVYLGLLAKAAIYLEGLVNYHVFLDGNKRTGLIVMARFLWSNGYELTASNRAIEKLVLRVAVEKLDWPVIARWLEQHSRKI